MVAPQKVALLEEFNRSFTCGEYKRAQRTSPLFFFRFPKYQKNGGSAVVFFGLTYLEHLREVNAAWLDLIDRVEMPLANVV